METSNRKSSCVYTRDTIWPWEADMIIKIMKLWNISSFSSCEANLANFDKLFLPAKLLPHNLSWNWFNVIFHKNAIEMSFWNKNKLIFIYLRIAIIGKREALWNRTFLINHPQYFLKKPSVNKPSVEEGMRVSNWSFHKL